MLSSTARKRVFLKRKAWMMSELKELAEKVGTQFLATAKSKLEGAWDELEQQGRDALEACARDRARLMVKALGGEDVSNEIGFVDATIANWTWVGAEKARKALVEAAEEVAEIVGSLLGAAVKGIL